MEAEMRAAGIPPTASNESKDGKKKKKKKDKPHAMSLDQFQQLPPEKVPGSDDEGIYIRPSSSSSFHLHATMSYVHFFFFLSLARHSSSPERETNDDVTYVLKVQHFFP
jgi:hypothetical protein